MCPHCERKRSKFLIWSMIVRPFCHFVHITPSQRQLAHNNATLLPHIYKELCDRSRYQGQGQVITSHIYCGIQILVSVLILGVMCLSSWIRYPNPKLIIKTAIWKCPLTVQMSEMYLNELIKRIIRKHKWLHIVRNMVYYITGCFGELHVNVSGLWMYIFMRAYTNVI